MGRREPPLRIESAHGPGRRRRVHPDRHASARRCCSKPTSSSATSRASTSASRTTRATPSSRSPWRDDFPRIERTRKLPADGSRYFGPYASASSVDEAMNLIRRLFPFRTCTIEIREGERALARPCLLYHIKRCQGPCIEAISKDDYRRDIEQVMLFLEGRQELVARALREEMEAASARPPSYERAAALRDKLRAIERTMESQKMAAFARHRAGRAGLRARGQRGGRAALRDPRRQDRRPRRVPARERGRRARRRGAVARSSSSTTRRAGRCRRASWCPSLPPEADELDAFLEARRGRQRRARRAAAGRATGS